MASRALCPSSPLLYLSILPSKPLYRPFSLLSRPPPNYPGHIPLTVPERLSLAVGSSLISLFNPSRGDLVAVAFETTSTIALRRLRTTMLSHPVGRRILRERPRLSSSTLSLPHLRNLPSHTLGATYVAWLDREHVTPDTRAPVRYVDDEELAYVLQRYRECHDFYHAITGLPVWVEGEVAVKALEAANLGLPMAGLAVGAVARLSKKKRERFWSVYGPWAVRNGLQAESLLNVYWEEELDKGVEEVRKRLRIELPPDLRAMRKREKAERQRGGNAETR